MPVVFINLYWIYHANTKGMNVMLDSWGMYIIKIIYLNWIYSANIWGIYVIWRVSVRPSGARLGNMSGQECTFSYMYTGQLPPGAWFAGAQFTATKFPWGPICRQGAQSAGARFAKKMANWAPKSGGPICQNPFGHPDREKLFFEILCTLELRQTFITFEV